ncbi:hypothetical protein ONS95_006951 [Cadophora gregata]|uniref:uncharacterized protein n=1 Tax=Cadophora gregata TaxID=51156 RepID=UPI0026DC50DC|nr:uncharacterized protein ONS95_006951 [Cadophora gregata]KAK0101801.1 hypothetical protein ONS95_006951 [Cadophora gregata]KAK0106184.1 hypothetical protein ONS96_003828 [Cadophora gregata f. sp. sojae]
MEKLDRPVRSRQMPLVPEPFSSITIALLSHQFNGRHRFLPRPAGTFVPNLDIPEYHKTMTNAQQKTLDERVDTLVRHATQCFVDKVSEATLEADVRSDVFGYIREDRSLRIDKRAYEFVTQNADGEISPVNKRIPDATMGLRAYNEITKNVPLCAREDCVIDHGPEAHDKLHTDNLLALVKQGQCGLVVDGVWGKAEVVLPWGVYEAKREDVNPNDAEDQVVHAARTYLGMLDDLARNPEDVTKYQFEDSCNYQVFCFTSCGAKWSIAAAYPTRGSCKFEIFWQGNTTNFYYAYELLCIVDQIQKYANTTHRNFVIKHLDAWYKRYDKFYKPLKRTTPLEAVKDPLYFHPTARPGWVKLKSESHLATQLKASLTRKRRQDEQDPSSSSKRQRRESTDFLEDDSYDLNGEEDAETVESDTDKVLPALVRGVEH